MSEVIRIPNIKNYTQKFINGELILTPIQNNINKKYISENELINIMLTPPLIINISCIINKDNENISTNISSKSILVCLRSVLVDIWKYMPTQKILQNTTFNFKLTDENGQKGYKWCSDIHMSFQDKNAQLTLTEILSMIKINNMSINLYIKLENGTDIYFK
jgi:hypothetical protein